MSRRLLLTASIAVLLVIVVGVAIATRPSEDHVALAIQGAERTNGTVLLTVECATDIEVEQQSDPLGSDLVQVTVWGAPKNGTCHPDVALDGLSADQLVDGATSQVVAVERSS